MIDSSCGSSFYGCSFLLWKFPYTGKNCKYTCCKLSANISLALIPSSRFNIRVYFRLVCQIPIIEMLSLNRNEKVICDISGTHITKLNLARHKKRCSAGTLYCTQCLNFFTKSENDMNYHIAKKHSVTILDVTFKCKLSNQEFSGFYASRQHKDTQHGRHIRSGAS